MAFLRKILIIMWKNWIIRKRHFIMTALELLLPTFLSIIVVLLRTSGGSNFGVTYIDQPKTYDENPIIYDDVYFCSNYPNQTSSYGRNRTILYTPEKTYTRKLMNCVQNYLQRVGSVYNVRSVGNENEIEQIALEEMAKDNNSSTTGWDFDFVGGIVFRDDFVDDEPPKEFHYRIRRWIPYYYEWNTDSLTVPFGGVENMLTNVDESYTFSSTNVGDSFVQLQHIIAMFHLENINKTAVEKYMQKNSMQDNYKFTTQKFPFPPYYKDSEFLMFMSNTLPLSICLSYVFIAPTLIKRIVSEKELGIKELMKMMGLHGWIQWIGWFLSSFIMMVISAFIIVFLLCTKFSNNLSIFDKSAPELIFFTLVFYIAASIAFCFFISSFFSKPSLATGVGCIIWIVSFVGPYYSLLEKYASLNLSEKLSLCLLPNMALALAIKSIAEFEGKALGLKWSGLAIPANDFDQLTILHIWGMLFVDMFIYFILTWYMDNVFPGIYGIKKPAYFLFTKSYWLGDTNQNIEDELSDLKNPKNFEKDPEGLTPTIKIKNLFKRYTAGHLAVNNVTLNMYEGQITALLGHNGAGKTTTMSILTGMIPPTKGTAYIGEYDISTNTDKARQSIGLCPQHNMLFESLTVKEHLMFFGKLKGMTGKALENEVKFLLEKLQLYDKRNTFAQALSGGMKRKLNLGIALVGGTKVVMLDEPTSGLDPEARRAIWDLLQEFRKDRCILLTTHFMEEADVLGDRIAIMAHGHIQCCGTTMFLKKRFGAGYHLNISKKQNCDVMKLTNIIHQHLPQAYIDNHTSNEISFTLMSSDTERFPGLFHILESNLNSLGINGFGLSVTTMEEVFLKVGEMADIDSDSGEDQDFETININSGQEISALIFNTGFQLWLQRFWGLLLKRWHYGHRRWSLIIAQIVIPALIVLGILLISNSLTSSIPMEPARTIDISQYGNNTALLNSVTQEFEESYAKSFFSNTVVKSVENISSELINVGTDSFVDYSQNYIVAAEEEDKKIKTMFNVLHYHSLPMSLNLVHNSILNQFNNTGWKIVVENAPLPKDQNHYKAEAMQTIKATLMGVFIPIGLSIMAASYVIFPIHERVSKAKHLQLMTGTGGLLFWGSSFLWDFGIHILSCCVMTIIFAIADTAKMVIGDGQLGYVFFLCVMYGWAAIPFSYAFSFISNAPSSGFNKLTTINLIAGIIFGFLIFFFKVFGTGSLRSSAKILQWFVRFIPIFPITMGFMMTPLISQQNLACKGDDVQACVMARLFLCKITSGNTKCPKIIDYAQWDFPGIGQEYFMLFVDGILYFGLIFLIERGILYRLWYILKAKFKKVNPVVEIASNVTLTETIDSDVSEENQRVNHLAALGHSSQDALLVHNLSKHFWNFVAVDKLSFGVKTSECFGLLGINGAGKTTTFRMLTGDETITDGNAYIENIVLKENRSEFLQKISYCPQFDALIDYLTGRETLSLFANLRGIDKTQLTHEINKSIEVFDLTEHADKVTKVYSGGNKRKLSAAIAFLGNRPLVFLDEPTTGVDPGARRKLWNILLASRNAGTSIILTSHSMEECEVLCSRVAIMVNGKFQCMGGTQHLKNKFSEGYTVMAKLKPSPAQESVQRQLQNFICNKFPKCILKDIHQGVVHYQILDKSISWAYLFQVMETAKQQFDLEDYSVSQATLEQVFLSFAKKQRVIESKGNTINNSSYT